MKSLALFAEYARVALHANKHTTRAVVADASAGSDESKGNDDEGVAEEARTQHARRRAVSLVSPHHMHVCTAFQTVEFLVRDSRLRAKTLPEKLAEVWSNTVMSRAARRSTSGCVWATDEDAGRQSDGRRCERRYPHHSQTSAAVLQQSQRLLPALSWRGSVRERYLHWRRQPDPPPVLGDDRSLRAEAVLGAAQCEAHPWP